MKQIFYFLIILLSLSINGNAQKIGGHVVRTKKENIHKSKQKKQMTKIERNRIINTLISNMIYVEGGTLMLGGTSEQGNENPPYSATVKSFFISRFEVTKEQWRAVMDCKKTPEDLQLQETSAIGFNNGEDWKTISSFLSKLNALTGISFRLPTVDEWEYAARGGMKSKGFKYSGSNNIDEVGWYSKNSDDHNFCVGLKLPNELGLYDMSGNVREWCQDKCNDTYNSGHIIKGGCWFDNASKCTVSSYECHADVGTSTYAINSIGIRLVCDRISNNE